MKAGRDADAYAPEWTKCARCGTLRRSTVRAHLDGHLVPVCSETDFCRRVRGLPAEIESPSPDVTLELYGEA